MVGRDLGLRGLALTAGGSALAGGGLALAGGGCPSWHPDGGIQRHWEPFQESLLQGFLYSGVVEAVYVCNHRIFGCGRGARERLQKSWLKAFMKDMVKDRVRMMVYVHRHCEAAIVLRGILAVGFVWIKAR